MPNAVKTEHPHIVRLEGVCGGEPVVDGLRVTVRHVATLHRAWGNDSGDCRSPGTDRGPGVPRAELLFRPCDEITALMAQEEQAHAEFSGT